MYTKSVLALFLSVGFFCWTQSQDRRCSDGWFDCKNGQCIASLFVCDGEDECENGLDELDCRNLSKIYANFRCSKGHYKCNQSMTCIPETWICDGHKDCPQDDDEGHCLNKTCDGFLCKNQECIPKRWHCDLTKDCADGSDEVGCTLNPETPSKLESRTKQSLGPKEDAKDDDWTDCFNRGKEFFTEGANCTLPSFYSTKCKEAFQEGCRHSETLIVCQNGKESAIKKWPCFGLNTNKPSLSKIFQKCCSSCRSGLAAGKVGSCIDSTASDSVFTECCILASGAKSNAR